MPKRCTSSYTAHTLRDAIKRGISFYTIFFSMKHNKLQRTDTSRQMIISGDVYHITTCLLFHSAWGRLLNVIILPSQCLSVCISVSCLHSFFFSLGFSCQCFPKKNSTSVIKLNYLALITLPNITYILN